jgi:hypothetical protein
VVLEVFRDTNVFSSIQDSEVFQDWIFLADRQDELLHIRSRHFKANTTDAIALPQSKGRSGAAPSPSAAVRMS